MHEPITKVDLESWVKGARADPVAYAQRQATEVILNTIAAISPFERKLFLKGGVLMGLAYDSPRQTTDIDLTAGFRIERDTEERITTRMDETFPRVIARLGYVDLSLKVHSVRRQPKRHPETAEFPALAIKVGYASRRGTQERALLAGRPANTVGVDISFNEPLPKTQLLEISGGETILAYSLVDVIAEKYRALFQQAIRRRNRRQDVYDLDFLLARIPDDPDLRDDILGAIQRRCAARHITPTIDTIDDPELKRRAATDWGTLKLELGDAVPDFDPCFGRVQAFYRSLPWSTM